MSRKRFLMYRTLNEINILKNQLIEVGNEVDHYADPLLIDVSQRLDEKLIQFWRLSEE